MTVLVHCPQCTLDRRRRVRVDNVVVIDPTQPVEWQCNRGHQNRLWVQNPFYELLFMRGIYDLREHDYRNAVINFFGAYETFTATTVRLLSGALGMSTSIPDRTGTMLAVFSALFEVQAKARAPKRVSGRANGIRNAVAHGELVPSEQEALLVGEEVRRFIRETIDGLKPLHEGPPEMPEIRKRAVAAYNKVPPKPTARPVTSLGFQVDFDSPIRPYLGGHTASGRGFRPI